MTMSPSGLCSILSIPFGPIELRITRATALAALMLAFWASSPFMRLLRSCSCAHHRLPSHVLAAMLRSTNSLGSFGFRSLREQKGVISHGGADLDDDERPSILIEGQTHRDQEAPPEAGPSD